MKIYTNEIVKSIKFISPAIKVRWTFAAKDFSEFFLANLIIAAGSLSLITFDTVINKCIR